MPIIIEGPDGAGKSALAGPSAGALGMNIPKTAADGVVIDRCRVSGRTYPDPSGRGPRIGDATALEDDDPAAAMEEVLECMS